MEEDFTLPHLFQVDSTGVQVDFVDSRWTPGTIYFAGGPAKLLYIIHMEFIWTPHGVQVNPPGVSGLHLSDIGKFLIIGWTPPGLHLDTLIQYNIL